MRVQLIGMSVLLACTAVAGLANASPSAQVPAKGAESPASVIDRLVPTLLEETVQVSKTTVSPFAARRVSLPTAPTDAVVIKNGPMTTTVKAEMPASARYISERGLASFDVGSWAVSYQPVGGDSQQSVRTLFTIKDRTAPTTFVVDMGLPAGQRMVANVSGGVDVVDSTGRRVQEIEKPWAVDAAGKAISTTYEVQGTRLIQHVAITSETQLPAVADPWIKIVWKWVWTGIKWIWTAVQVYCTFWFCG